MHSLKAGHTGSGSGAASPLPFGTPPRRGSLPTDPRSAPSSCRGVEWDAGLSFTCSEGTGVSACEEAGYIFGAQEYGVRGKAGTPGFWAPEMLYYERDGKGRRYGPASDWWSFGCLRYAILAARGPFTVIGGDTADDNAATLQNEPDLNPATFSPIARSLLAGLLEKDPRKRLGCGPGGVSEVRAPSAVRDACMQV